MSDLVLSLKIKADGSTVVGEVKKATGAVKGLEKQAKQTGSEAGRLSSALSGFGAKLAGLFAGQQIGSFLVNTIRQTGVLKASLETVTGSIEGAEAAWEGLEGFAASTPYSINQVTDAFVKLKAFGLDPSMEAITSYGNTAAAMGKGLDQMIEAVADAATMEFERLKEFGIKTRQEGDNVTFTFRGVTTTIKKNAEDIEKYLQNIGKTDFAGAMEKRSQTLDGAISNMQDSLSRMANALGDAGLTDLFNGIAKAIGGAATAVTNLIKGDGAGLPQWARVAGFTIRQIAVEAADLPDAIEAMLASVVAWAKGDEETLAFIAADRKKAREDIDAAAAAYVASLEGIAQAGKLKPSVDPFAKGAGQQGETAEQKKAREAREKLLKSIDDDVKALELEAQTFGMTDKAAELYTLRLKGATEAQLARAAAAYDSIEADRAFEEQVEATEEAVKAENEAYQEWVQDQKEAADAVRNAVDPTRELRMELEKLAALRDGGFINADEYAARAKQIDEQIEKVKRGGDTVAKYWEQAAEHIQESLGNFLFRPFEQGLDGMLSSFVDMLHKMASEALAAQIMQKIFGEGGVGGFDLGGMAMSFFRSVGFGAAHAGGIVGSSTLMTRNVSPLAFAGAPRFHSGGMIGLVKDEVPIIAKRGEEVLTRDDPRHALNGGGAQQAGQGVRIVNVVDPALVSEFMTSSEGERVILNTLSKYRNTIQGV